LPIATIENVKRLILATQHNGATTEYDAAILVDCDLSILGAPEAEYKIFEQNIRREYRWVPYFLYRKKRVEILQSFLDRAQIFSSPLFVAQFEALARVNLQNAIAQLKI
jgi:predicted metal-dependent HD superfamily phosphohydrolase